MSRKRSNTNAPEINKQPANAPSNPDNRPPKGHLSSGEDVDKNVLRFVYSEAVDTAMRRKYVSSAFPANGLLTTERSNLPKQAPKIKVVEILKLPQIFDDFRSVRIMRKKNVQREKRWRDRMTKKGLPVFDQNKMDDTSRKTSTIKLPKLPWRMMGSMLTTKHGGGNDGDRSPNVKTNGFVAH